VELYKNRQWHNPPVRKVIQTLAGVFQQLPFLKRKFYRINKTRVKLSEMFTVYWEYVERHGGLSRKRGNSAFEEGFRSNAVPGCGKNMV